MRKVYGQTKPPLGAKINFAHPLARGIVGFWLFNESGGNKVYDLSGNENTGTLTNMAFPSAVESGWNPGKFGYALRFDGIDDYIRMLSSSTLNLGSDNFTIVAWVYNTEDIDKEIDQLGDIATKFDQSNKKGVNLGILRQSAAGSQSNYRNLYFSIDNNKPDTIWVQRAPKLEAETYIFSLAVYNGKLYGGTYPNGNLYEWNGTDAWVQRAPKREAETNIISLAVYNGKLYGGTYPKGNLYEWKTGVGISYDYALPSGRHHILAVRDTTTLKLFLDGTLIGTSASFTSSDYDLSNTADLLIGFGQQDYLKGLIDAVCIYNRALTAAEILQLYSEPFCMFN